VITALLVFEALNYAMHRAMHEMKGPVGRFLWLSHAAHHLPPRLYLIMHAVFHPINAVFIQTFAIILPIWLMGYDQKAVTMFMMINGLHGLISHFNVDVRLGWFNYIFVGPETHRYHHSADVKEAKNYGNTLTIFDILFGTFVYKPGKPPAELGVDANAGFPSYDKTLSVLAMPFRKGS
jgi:sterol desaturase/sphingolipid hydroxylase (fatty acid hydroxylase superfamily)